MNCPICHGEMSRTWQPQRSSNPLPLPHVQWGCSTCGGKFTRDQLRLEPKRKSKATPEPSLS
jgi:transposase-like protein